MEQQEKIYSSILGSDSYSSEGIYITSSSCYHGDDDVKISSIIIIVEMGPLQCHKYYHKIGIQMKLQMKVQMKSFQQTFVL